MKNIQKQIVKLKNEFLVEFKIFIVNFITAPFNFAERNGFDNRFTKSTSDNNDPRVFSSFVGLETETDDKTSDRVLQ